MCLGVPGRVIERYDDHGLAMGKVDFDGICRPVCLAHTPEVTAGEYVLVHVGFALQILESEDAMALQLMLRESSSDDLDERLLCSQPGSSLEGRTCLEDDR